MKAIIILSIIAVVFGVVAVMCCINAVKSKQELNKLKKREKENAKIDQKTNEQIESITSGYISDDLLAGAELLHEFAKRK